MENPTFGIVAFAVLIEALITYYKDFTGEKFSWEIIVSLVLGIIIAIAYRLDLPAYFNLNSQIPYLGNILTGILLSRGSNYGASRQALKIYSRWESYSVKSNQQPILSLGAKMVTF